MRVGLPRPPQGVHEGFDNQFVETEVHLAATTTSSSHERMKTLESRLDPKYFARVHRSAIVNLREVTSYTSVRHGDCELVLRSGDVVRLTRTRRTRVVERLSALGVETT